MALTTFQNGLQFWPCNSLPSRIASAPALVDATGEAQGNVFTAPISGTITAIGFRLGAVTTGDTISAEVQGALTASAIPNNTIFAAGAGNSFSLTTTMANTWQVISLATACNVSVGERIAVCVKRADTGGAGNFEIGNISINEVLVPCGCANALGAWASSVNGIRNVYPIFSGTSMPAFHYVAPFNLGPTLSLSAGSTPDEVGNVINFPFKCRASGYYFSQLVSMSSTTSVNFTLYDSDGTTTLAASTCNLQTDLGIMLGHFTPVVLNANTNYRIAAMPSAGPFVMMQFSLADATAMGMLNLGTACFGTSRTDAGAWSDNTAMRNVIGLILDQFDDSSASGGTGSGLAHIIGGGM
jgi:hypothetical protein